MVCLVEDSNSVSFVRSRSRRTLESVLVARPVSCEIDYCYMPLHHSPSCAININSMGQGSVAHLYFVTAAITCPAFCVASPAREAAAIID